MKKTTKQLAKELGFIRKRTSSPSVAGATEKRVRSHQLFAYLIVIDFESTCWNDGRPRNGQEIIEFPAVLLNAANGQIENEFRTYLQPQEHPLLSAFCTELTGIQQHQVEAGVPLHICLSQFGHWLRKLQEEKNIVFARDLERDACEGKKPCAFVTWSDWDLGVCLKGECQRKQIRRPDVLNSWIDLRVTYRMFYERKPKGLNGALQDLGICFTGREHSGLDDARNTAQLAWRMICDGCTMKITKSIDRAQGYRSSVPPVNTPAEERGSSKGLDEIAGPSRRAMTYSEHSEINTKRASIRSLERQRKWATGASTYCV
ncbi:ERI1 exoribonuclease 2 isoform X1 [Lethenteron reissneri]|uniref:ERI1 exoribonuclease 2 isoform X1 n=1 Tax=Lethenteron reissneri TaxID=7753 RepID=UPI002AB60D1E|nr:ERI1 exoribonuclease 2 isoform X1 [Lethenteron reissneri]